MDPLMFLGGAAAAYLGYKIFVEEKKAVADPTLGEATQLDTGKNYMALVAVNGSGVLPRDPQQAAVMIGQAFMNVGFQPIPNGKGGTLPFVALKDDAARKAFMEGATSTWTITGKWTRAEKAITDAPPPFIGQVKFYPLPV